MRRRFQAIIFLALAAIVPVRAVADGLEEGRKALSEGLSIVAVEKLRTYLAGAPEPPNAEAARRLLGEALLLQDQPRAALEAITGLEDDPELILLRGRCQAALKDWEGAVQSFQSLEQGVPDRIALAAAVGEAEALEALGKRPEAIAALERARAAGHRSVEAGLLLAGMYADEGEMDRSRELIDSIEPETLMEKKWKIYLDGRIQLSRGKAQRALDLFESMWADGRGLPEALEVGVTLGVARAQILRGQPDLAIEELEDFPSDYENSALLDVIFAALDQVLSAQRHPPLGTLRKWIRKEPSLRTALSLYYLARAEARGGDPNAAIRLLESFIEDYPDHPRLAEIRLFQVRLLAEVSDYDEVLKRTEIGLGLTNDPTLRALFENAAGGAWFKLGNFKEAARWFERAAKHESPARELAIFNAALARLNQRDYHAFFQDYRQLSSEFPEGTLRRELIFEEGLLQARHGEDQAENTLRQFVQDFPDNRRVPDASLALAELAFVRNPKDVETASRYLRVANEQATSNLEDRTECLEIFVKSNDPKVPSDEVVARGLDFIRRRPASSLIPDVRMKLGEIYFRNGDFANARTQFEIVESQYPDSAYAGAALYLAAQAAQRSMNPDRALELFEAVAKKNGPLKLYARQEQAALKSRLGDDAEAIILYENVLAGDPPPELKYAALAGKGISLMTLGRKDPNFTAQALETFEMLATLPEVPPTWRNQALYRKAAVLKAQGNESAALAALYDVLDQSTKDPAKAETFWFYKAGFEAAEILAERRDWKGCEGIYEKMLLLEGPRKPEIEARLSRLRLEHFLWEE